MAEKETNKGCRATSVWSMEHNFFNLILVHDHLAIKTISIEYPPPNGFSGCGFTKNMSPLKSQFPHLSETLKKGFYQEGIPEIILFGLLFLSDHIILIQQLYILCTIFKYISCCSFSVFTSNNGVQK